MKSPTETPSDFAEAATKAGPRLSPTKTLLTVEQLCPFDILEFDKEQVTVHPCVRRSLFKMDSPYWWGSIGDYEHVNDPEAKLLVR